MRATLRRNSFPATPQRRKRGGDRAPVSFSQQRLWFLEQLEPNSARYNISRAMRMMGSLDLGALQASLDNLVARHEPLRTTFLTVDGHPVQLIGESRSIDLALIDLTSTRAEAREERLQSFISEHSNRPFDLASDLMLRAVLLRMSEEEHVLLLTMHHIASDGWSLSILFRELAALYEAFLTGKPSVLPDLPFQYRDYALWQRELLRGPVLQKQLAYWKDQLSGAPPLLELPTDRPRPAVQSFVGDRRFLILPKDLVGALKELGRRERATLYMVTLAAFQSLLHRYSNSENILVGSPIAGRNRKETEDLIGFFVNTLVLRGDFSSDPSFKELLTRVRTAALGAYEHQDLPFEKLVEELHPERTLSYSPLFQVALAFQNVPSAAFELPGLNLVPLEIDARTSKFDLTLYLYDESGTLKAEMEYNADLFDGPTIERMLGHYHTLLESIVADPECRISDLPILTEREKHQLLIGWNDTERARPKDKCIHELFEEQAEKTPDAVAVRLGDRQMVYGELNRRANQLAHYLRKVGVGPDTLVGICVERSFDMVVGLLGILKAGGAYVPLDPAYPRERLQFMLEDTAAPVLLTQQGLAKDLPKQNAKVVLLDRDWPVISRECQDDPAVQTSADNLAYVIYTSGSTGKPKGVEICHRGITRLVAGAEYVRFGSSEVFLQLAPTSFDASTFELWGALAHGSQCVLFPGRIPTPHELATVLRKYGVTTLWLTSSLFNTVIDQAPEALAVLSQLLTGGEALSVSHVRRALSVLPNTTIINGYGPTESTTFACCYRIPSQLDPTINSVPIGRPIANTTVYILDSKLNPVPIGVPGELYIGGDGLARGYLKRPGVTAEKFLADPFRCEPGARLYRTGDLARYLADGNIEFLGRADDQVKIRGFRIELGEIENTLKEHPSVRNAVVVAREDAPGNKNLIGYVVPSQSRAANANELKRFLLEKMPDYMVPSAFVLLDALPITPNGKVDRNSLPVPGRSMADPAGERHAPRNALEETLARIWAEALDLKTIGVRDNFFDSGGHSLTAVRVANAIEKTIGRPVGVSSIFQAPTIEQLASLLNEGNRAAPATSLVPLQTEGKRPPFFWIHGQTSDAVLPVYLGPEQPLYGLQHQSQDGTPALYKTVRDIAAHYLEEMQSVQSEGPFYLGGYCFGALVAFEIARQLQAQRQDVALLALLNPGGETRRGGGLPQVSSSEELRRHLRAFSSLALRDQWRYLADRALQKAKSEATQRIVAPIEKIAHPLIWKICERFGVSIPLSLRSSYILKIYARALRAYAPQRLDVDLILLLTDDYSADLVAEWRARSTGKVNVHRIPGDHTSVLLDPHAKVWAEKVKACLNRAGGSESAVSEHNVRLFNGAALS